MNSRLSALLILFTASLSFLPLSSSGAPAETNLPSYSAPAAANAASPPVATPTDRPATYPVLSGDTLWYLSHKFNCSVSSLKKLNNLKKTQLKPGQVLKIPPARKVTASQAAGSGNPAIASVAPVLPRITSVKKVPSTLASSTANPAVSWHPQKTAGLEKKTDPRLAHEARLPVVAQPVQDFDIPPASTFASCPVPPPALQPDLVPPSEPETASSVENPPAPVAENPRAKPVPVSATLTASPTPPNVPAPSLPPPVPAKQPGFFANLFHSKPVEPSPSGEWGNRFLQEARTLGNRNIDYNESWRPEGEAHAWDMDCSNTARYLYRVTAGIALPRTASDQYYYLHLQNKAWDAPQASNGFADCNFLRANLKPGDLLFWENTYKPERQPPITHVMVFLGSNSRGQWIMAGSQSGRGGEHNRRRGGPDVYVFDPTHACGGYTTWLGMVHHQGRFCAYGRPLEADVKKLAVAAND